jgi:hypothetical protein
MNIPRRVYKFRPFGERLLTQLCEGELYFADPTTFNDPLDCRPVIVPDIDKGGLEKLFSVLFRERHEARINLAYKDIRVRGEAADQRREKLILQEIKNHLTELKYWSGHPDIDDPAAEYQRTLLNSIVNELRMRQSKAVLSLATSYRSPLMWSHYGDQHRGVCVEYDTTDSKGWDLHEVRYGKSREINASMLLDAVANKNANAAREVDDACYLVKSRQWRYEKEWRVLREKGAHRSSFKLNALIFGMKCAPSVQTVLFRSLVNRWPGLTFWRIPEPSSEFVLTRTRLSRYDIQDPFEMMNVANDFDAFVDSAE